MNFKAPKNTPNISWTRHSIEKMRFYGLTPQRVLRILKSPERCENAVTQGCVACMQIVGAKRKTEIWMMYQNKLKTEKPALSPSSLKGLGIKLAKGLKLKTNGLSNKFHKKIITAWRYPGISPKREVIPIPQDILNEIEELIK